MDTQSDDRAGTPIAATRPALPRSGLATTALVGLFALAVAFTLYIAADLLVPVAFAIFLNILLSPAVRRLQRIGVSPVISAALIMLTLVGIVSFGVLSLASPAEQWLAEAPTTLRELKTQVVTAKGHLQDIQEVAEAVEDIALVDANSSGPQPVVVAGPGILEGLLGGLPAIATDTGIVIFLTYFLLASGDSMLRRLTQCARSWSGRRRIVTIAREIQSDLSRYLGVVTIMNILLGTAIAGALFLLGVPNPVLWGVMFGALNFAPYVGAAVSLLVLTVVGLTTFPTIAEGLTVPAVALLLTTIEGQILTPAVLGRRMSLNPTVVFLSVVFWGWLWGMAGALMAVPIMTSLKVWFDHVPGQKHVGAFLRPSNWEATEREGRALDARAVLDAELGTENG